MRHIPRHRRHERGQGIAELCVALIGLSAVFLGVIFMLAVGQANIATLLEVRGVADAAALSGQGGGTGSPIGRWEAGGDNRMFTNDDEPTLQISDAAGLYQGQLRRGGFDLATNLSPEYVHENFSRDLADENMFLNAANLARGQATADPDDLISIDDLRGAFRALIYDGEITIRNEAYMPVLGAVGD